MAKKTLDDFKAQHDPATIIPRLEKELRTATEQLGLEEAIKGILGTVNLRTAAIDPPAWVTKPIESSSPGVPTLFLSDIHAGEVVNQAQISSVNAYDLDIFHDRMQYTIETAIHLLRILDKDMRYPGIVVPLGGDMVSGDIHEELVATNALPTIPTVLDLLEQLIRALKTLADQFGKVFVPCVSGNHGRNTKKIWAKNRNHTSFDWLLYQLLSKHFQNDKRFTFYVPQSADALYRIYGTRYLLTHGDQFRSGDSIIGPIGPIFRGNQKKLARNQAVGQDYDVMICGHWHQYIHIENLIVNGSMKGYDEYAASENYRFEPPRQGLWITHPRFGITYRMPVLCEKPRKPVVNEWASVLATKQ